MKIVVLIKQVPDMEKVRFDTEKGVIDRKSAGVEMNPFDLHALQAALDIKKQYGAEVLALSMGPMRAEQTIREALARGADRGILLTDPFFAGADTWATAFTLSRGLIKIKDFDLIIGGEMTVDGDTAQVGPQTAEFLQIPHLAYVNKINNITSNSIICECSIWEGVYLKAMQLPGLITVTKDLNFPRLPTLKNKLRSRKTEITSWGFSDIKGDAIREHFGLKGSPTAVKKIIVPPLEKRQSRIYQQEKLSEAVTEIKILLSEQKTGGKNQ